MQGQNAIPRELHTREEIYDLLTSNHHDNDGKLLPVMFHGTDASLVGISEGEREGLFDMCDTVIKSMRRLYKENGIDPCEINTPY